MNAEACRAAIEEGRLVFQAQQGLPNALVVGALSMLRKLREIARRGACYPLPSGDRLEGVHPADVTVALQVLARFGGVDEIMGPLAEDAMARALAAVDEARAHRLARASGRRSPYRQEQVDADLAVARARAVVRHTVTASRR